jgi:hypothetical protein
MYLSNCKPIHSHVLFFLYAYFPLKIVIMIEQFWLFRIFFGFSKNDLVYTIFYIFRPAKMKEKYTQTAVYYDPLLTAPLRLYTMHPHINIMLEHVCLISILYISMQALCQMVGSKYFLFKNNLYLK